MNKKVFIFFVLIGCSIIFFLSIFLIKYYEDYQARQIEHTRLQEWGTRVSGSLTTSQTDTYEKNRTAIDTFIGKLDSELRTWMKYVTIVSLDDLNTYFERNDRNPLRVSDVELVDNNTLLGMIEHPSSNRIILDIRDEYEQKFVKLSGVRTIRLGDLVNNAFMGLPKDMEIIVLCHTDARSFVAVNYLLSQGFINVKAYKGGIIAWLAHKNPVLVNKRFVFIYDVLPYVNDTEISEMKRTDSSVEELLFAPYAESENAIQSLLMSSKALDDLIAGLSPNKKYIIRCTDHHHCFDAVSFWDRAKRENLQFVGYTGYVFK